MNATKTVIAAINEIEDINNLVTILELITSKLEINTISETARLENKSPNGIRNSNCYRKIKIGKQLFAIKGIKENNLPF